MAEPTFRNSQEFERWLEGKPREWAQVLALRSALRVAPLAMVEFAYPEHALYERMAGTLARCLWLAWGEATSELRKGYRHRQYFFRSTSAAHEALFRSRAIYKSATSSRVYDARPPDAARTAADMAAHAGSVVLKLRTGFYGKARRAVEVTESAADAANATAARPGDLWDALSIDAGRLEDFGDPEGLLGEPLWQVEPDWIKGMWVRAKSALKQIQPHETFATWFERRIKGRQDGYPFREGGEAEFFNRLIECDDGWWGRLPTAVDSDIAEWLRELAPGGDAPNEDTAREILQSTASPQAFIQDGQLHLRANTEYEVRANRTDVWLTQHLLDLAQTLANGLSDNAPPALRAALTKYAEVIGRDLRSPVLQTLESCIAIVRPLHVGDGHESWAAGLQAAFADLFASHTKLTGDYPAKDKQAEERARLQPNMERLGANPLSEDVERFAQIVSTLKEMNVTSPSAQAYLDAMVAIGMEASYISPDLEALDPDIAGAPTAWKPSLVHRANMTGLALQMESQIAIYLSVTAHPQF